MVEQDYMSVELIANSVRSKDQVYRAFKPILYGLKTMPIRHLMLNVEFQPYW